MELYHAFNVTAAQTVPTMAAMDALVQTTITSTIRPFACGHPDTGDITTRNIMPVPPRCTNIIFGTTFTSCKLWQQLAVPIINDGLAADCARCLDWLRIAATRPHNTPPNASSQPPVNHLGAFANVFPIAAKDRHMARHRWEIIQRDLPALACPCHLSPNDQLIHIFSDLRQDHAAQRAADEACRCG